MNHLTYGAEICCAIVLQTNIKTHKISILQSETFTIYSQKKPFANMIKGLAL